MQVCKVNVYHINTMSNVCKCWFGDAQQHVMRQRVEFNNDYNLLILFFTKFIVIIACYMLMTEFNMGYKLVISFFSEFVFKKVSTKIRKFKLKK